MATQGDLGTEVPSAPANRGSRLRQWGTKRSRQLLKALRVFLVGLAFFLAVVMIWRGTRLIGLPNVGDPFDVAALLAQQVPDERNAFTLFHQAMTKLYARKSMPPAVMRNAAAITWSTADPKMKEWAEGNREILDLFRQASEQSDASIRFDDQSFLFQGQRLQFRPFVRLALLEASRLEEQGDMEGAWGWYQTVLRMRRHVLRRAALFDRYTTLNYCGDLLKSLTTWASDPRTEVSLLRRALDEVLLSAPRSEWDSHTLQLEYYQAMKELENPMGIIAHGADEDRKYDIAGEQLPPNLALQLYYARRFLSHEPELSRRTLRLTYANWLGHIQDTDSAHRQPVARALFSRWGQKSTVFLYKNNPSASLTAKTMAPEDLAKWLVSASDAQLLLFQWPWPSTTLQERKQHRALLILLAEELYRRERGTAPVTEQALIGPYLKSLPDDGSGDLDDGTAITIEKPSASSR